jgi:hypothetical protein
MSIPARRPRQLSAPQPMGLALGLARTVGMNSQKRSPGERSDPGAGVPACRWRSCGLRFCDVPPAGKSLRIIRNRVKPGNQKYSA